MEERRFQQNDEYVVTYNHVFLPKIGFGTAGLGFTKSYSSTFYALSKGFKMIDSAQAKEWYLEEEIGRAFQDYLLKTINDASNTEDEEFKLKYEDIRKQYKIVSKLHPRDFGYHKAINSIESTLTAFGTDYIDVFLLHAPSCWPEENEEAPSSCRSQMGTNTWIDAYKGLEELYRMGKVRSIGVSNFDLNLLGYLVEEVAEIQPMVVQNWFDPFHRDDEVREFCASHKIIYMAYSTLGTQWPYQIIQGKPLDTNPILTNKVVNEILLQVQEKIKDTLLSPALIVLLWALQIDSNNNNLISLKTNITVKDDENSIAWRDRGLIILPRSSKEEHIDELALLIHLLSSSEFTCENSSGSDLNKNNNEKKDIVWLDDDQFETFSQKMHFSTWNKNQ